MGQTPPNPMDGAVWLPGGSASDTFRRRDWTHSPLGPIAEWPASLRVVVSLMLQSTVPTVIHWGDDLVRLYNDAFAAVAPRPDPPLGGALVAHGMPDAATVEMVRAGEAVQRARTVLHHDGGGQRVFTANHSPVRDETGAVRGVLTSLVERAPESAQLIVQHRMRNMVANLRSIARRTAETSDTIQSYVDHFDGRLDALARGQVLAGAPEGGISLEEIVAEELTAQSARVGENARVEGPPVALSFEAAGMFGLALHELAVNAVEHGALTAEGGEVSASWTLTDGGELRFDWIERSALALPSERSDAAEPPDPERPASEPEPAAPASAPEVPPPSEVPAFDRSGFGREVIERTLPFQMDARTELARTPEGVRCSVVLPPRHIVSAFGGGERRGPM